MDAISLLTIVIIVLVLIILAAVFLYLKGNNSQSGIDLNGLQKQLEISQNHMFEMMRSMENKVISGEREMKRSVEMQFQESQKLISEITEKMRVGDTETRKVLGEQFQNANKLIREITEEITQVKEGNKQVLTITEQLSNLEKVLKNQKQRGNLGESSLELILSNILPPGAYQMQYEFTDKDIVDAIIKTQDGIIPVDAKFSLENYQRLVQESNEERKVELEKAFREDLKRRIDETSKYIKTNEGTLPFAFMFIPAEGIYYDLLINEVGNVKVNTRSLIDYAYNQKKVIIVSPTTFYAYLQSVLYGFKAFKIEESAKGIQKRVEELGKHLGVYEDFMKKLGSSMATSVNHYNNAYKELKKVDKDIVRITGDSFGADPQLLEKPSFEE